MYCDLKKKEKKEMRENINLFVESKQNYLITIG